MAQLKFVILFIILYVCSLHVQADDSIRVKQTTPLSDSIAQVDLPQLVFKKYLEKRKIDSVENANKKIYWSVLPAVGSTPATGFAGLVLINAAFYTGDKSTTTLSSITTNFTLTAKSQIILPIRMNIWLKDNKWNLVGDWRFMKYPQATYGLGGRTPWSNEELISYSYFKVHQFVLRKVYAKFYSGIGINYDYFFNVKQSGYKGMGPSPYDLYPYGTGSSSSTQGFSMALLWDDRKNTINPIQGGYAMVGYRINPDWLGNQNPYHVMLLDVRKYFYVPARKHKNILAFWGYYWAVTQGDPPYMLLPSNGWDTYAANARGFIQGRYRSKQMITIEAEYRYRITRNGLVGGVVFTNASSFAEVDGRFKYVNPAVGAGLRIKLNKHSQTNIILDFAFGINNNSGFYADVGELF
ncbi:MAG: hypothetical protein MUE33_04525 [Cytophagaceae bacterium]|jgi:hypothetical protein|nr:hypothetical protein [Cytophagaceae bacterium]